MTRIIDPKGNPIKLTPSQKNAIYKKAKALRETVKSSLCSKTECWKPTEHNVKKMLNQEFKTKKHREAYIKHMKAIDADPGDYNVEGMRRGK